MDVHMEGGLRRRLDRRLKGKPEKVGGLVTKPLWDTRKAVHAGGHVVHNWEARQCGRPTAKIDVYMEAGVHWKPFCVYVGSLTQRRPQ